MITSNVEKAKRAPLPLPPSAWRVTADLQTAIERCLIEAGHQILWHRFTDNDYRHWNFQLLYGQAVDVSVDCDMSPGSVKIGVCGDDVDSIQALLSRYRKIPILKIAITLTVHELLGKLAGMNNRMMPAAPIARLKYAVRRLVTAARYKITREEHARATAAWILCLNTAQQLKVEGFGKCPQSELVISGFGTDSDRLWQLMEVFDDAV